MSKGPFDTDFISSLSDLTTIGRYEIIRKLGAGGAGVVYLGKDRYIKRYVAIKMANPTSERSRQRFFLAV